MQTAGTPCGEISAEKMTFLRPHSRYRAYPYPFGSKRAELERMQALLLSLNRDDIGGMCLLRLGLPVGDFSHYQSVVAMNSCGCSMPCSVVNASNRSRRPSKTAARVDTSSDLSTYSLFRARWNPALPILIYVPITFAIYGRKDTHFFLRFVASRREILQILQIFIRLSQYVKDRASRIQSQALLELC